MKPRRIGAIDIGTQKVCSMIAETDGSGLRILGMGVQPSHGLQKGQVVSLREARESVRESVRMAEQTAGFRMGSAVISVTGKHVSSRNKNGVISITSNRGQTVLPGDVRRVLSISRSEDEPDELVLHQIPRYYKIDGQDGINNPVGMHGYRLDVETHTVTASVNSIENIVKCVSGIGIKIENIVFEPLASGMAVLEEDEKRDGVILADIGAGTTNIAVYKGDSIFHSSVLPVAGNQVSRDLSIGLGISPDLAEELKLKYGSLIPGAATYGSDTENGEAVPVEKILDIISLRMEEIIRLVVIDLENATGVKNPASIFPAGLVLTGGTANTRGIAEFTQGVSHMPCRIGYPPAVSGIADNINDPAFSASFGLLIWKLESRDVSHQRVPGNGSGLTRFMNKLVKPRVPVAIN